MSGVAGLAQSELLLVPYTRAIELLKGREIRLTVITPPYPSLGLGPLRVVRVRDDGGTALLEATYDNFERLP